MPLNTVIRDKRKEIGLTQEQIADYLGVSTPAVNKWEKGSTYPDISLLPPLARLLKTDLNTLLCFEEGMNTQEINYFSKEVMERIEKDGYDSGFTMVMEKIQKYPNCGELIHTAALLLDGALMMYGADIEDKSSYENQIIALYERAAKSEEEHVRNGAIYMLVSKYMKCMEYDKAEELLELLPERTAIDKKQLKARLLVEQDKAGEAMEILERKLLTVLNEILPTLISLLDIELKEGNNENAQRLTKIYQEVVTLFDMWKYDGFIAPLQVALVQKDVQGGISALKEMLAAMLIPWEPKASQLYRHISTGDSTGKFGQRMLPSVLSELEKNPDYQFLHSNAEFQQLVQQYRAKC